MAKRGHLVGRIKNKSQLQNPKTAKWTKRGGSGKFQSVKSDDGPYRNIRKEK